MKTFLGENYHLTAKSLKILNSSLEILNKTKNVSVYKMSGAYIVKNLTIIDND